MRMLQSCIHVNLDRAKMMVGVMILQKVFSAYAVGILKDLRARVGTRQLH